MTIPVRLDDFVEADLDWMIRAEVEIFGKAAWSAQMIREDWNHGFSRYRLARRGSERIGYAVYGFDGDAFSLMNIAVVEAGRREGVATAFMDDLFAEATRLGEAWIWLEVAVDNAAAIALYSRYGFATVRVRKRYYQPGDIDALVMRASVGPGDTSG